jgi:predicted DNA-binding WGR domain protein
MRKEIYLVNAQTHSFFAIARLGTTVRERWGLLGEDGRHGRIECATTAKADFLLDSRVDRKLRHGYARC